MKALLYQVDFCMDIYSPEHIGDAPLFRLNVSQPIIKEFDHGDNRKYKCRQQPSKEKNDANHPDLRDRCGNDQAAINLVALPTTLIEEESWFSGWVRRGGRGRRHLKLQGLLMQYVS